MSSTTQAIANTSSSDDSSSGGAGGTSSTASTSGAGGSGANGSSGSSSAGNGGTGGSAGEESSITTSMTSTTGGVVITGELPWMDNFEDYPVNAPAGPNWTALESEGGWTIVADNGNQYYGPQAEASNRNMTYAGDPQWSDVRLQVDLRMREGGDSTRLYLAVRAGLDSSGNKLDYYHAYISGAGRVQLGRYLGGSTSEDTSNHQADTGVALDDTWRTLAVTVIGDTVSAELEGDEVVSGSLSGRSSGFIALGVQSGTAEFDNVTVTEP